MLHRTIRFGLSRNSSCWCPLNHNQLCIQQSFSGGSRAKHSSLGLQPASLEDWRCFSEESRSPKDEVGFHVLGSCSRIDSPEGVSQSGFFVRPFLKTAVLLPAATPCSECQQLLEAACCLQPAACKQTCGTALQALTKLLTLRLAPRHCLAAENQGGHCLIAP